MKNTLSLPNQDDPNHISALETLKNTIAKECISRASNRALLDTKGNEVDWVIDLKRCLFHEQALSKIAHDFILRTKHLPPFQVVGMEFSAVPIVTAIVLLSAEVGREINGVIVRKERKGTGLGNIVEGQFNSLPAIIVDDIINSGASLEKVRAVTEHNSVKVNSAYGVIQFHSRNALDWSRSHKIDVISPFSIDDFGLSSSRHPTIPESKFRYTVNWILREPVGSAFDLVPKSQPNIIHGQLLYGREDGSLLCCNVENGDVIWRFDANVSHRKGIWSSPAVTNENVVFGTYAGDLICLRIEDGTVVWRSSCCEYIGSSPCISEKLGLVFVGLENERPQKKGVDAAFCLESGKKIWEVERSQYQHGSAVLDATHDKVIFGQCDGGLQCYEAEYGHLVWSARDFGAVKSKPCLDNVRNAVIACDLSNNIFSVNLDTGALIWSFKSEGEFYSTPLVVGEKIFCGCYDKFLYVLDANDGILIRRIPTYSRVCAAPILADGNVVFGSLGGVVFELCPNSLEVLGTPTFPDAVTTAIAYHKESASYCLPLITGELVSYKRVPISG